MMGDMDKKVQEGQGQHNQQSGNPGQGGQGGQPGQFQKKGGQGQVDDKDENQDRDPFERLAGDASQRCIAGRTHGPS